jgi:putative phosphoribosyl transferase
VVLGVPVCAPDTARRLEAVADAVVCVLQPADFRAVGRWYRTFDQTSDAEVVELLDRARSRRTESRR